MKMTKAVSEMLGSRGEEQLHDVGIPYKGEIVNALGMDLSVIYKEAEEFYNKLKTLDGVEKPSKDAFLNAYVGYKALNQKLKNKNYITIVDFFPNNKLGGLLYLINNKTHTVEYSNRVGHGRGSRGEEDSPGGSPDSYSNELGSKQSSLGFFRTSEKIVPGSLHIWEGLRLEGLEMGINDNANKRAIFFHPAGLEQSDGCFTLPYDKAKGQSGEDEILRQLYKIRNNSIVFAYDSRVFGEYKKQSKIFSKKVVESSDTGLYIVNDNDDEVKERIKTNQENSTGSFLERSWRFLESKLLKSKYEERKERERECWGKKKEIEKLAAQMFHESETRIPENLKKKIKNIYLLFQENFYMSSPSERLEKIDKWVFGSSGGINRAGEGNDIEMYGFWGLVEKVVAEYGDLRLLLMKFINEKKSEYVEWENSSSANHRKIPRQDSAENRFKKVA